MACVEGKVTLVGGEDLQQCHFAACAGQLFQQHNAGLVKTVADRQQQVARAHALPQRAQAIGHRPAATRLQCMQLQVHAITLACAVRCGHQLQSIAIDRQQAETVALLQGQFHHAGGHTAHVVQAGALRCRAIGLAGRGVASSSSQTVIGLSRSDSRTKKRSERAYSFQSIWRSSSPGS